MLLSMSDNFYPLSIVLLVPDNLFLVVSQTDKKSYRRPAHQHDIEMSKPFSSERNSPAFSKKNIMLNVEGQSNFRSQHRVLTMTVQHAF